MSLGNDRPRMDTVGALRGALQRAELGELRDVFIVGTMKDGEEVFTSMAVRESPSAILAEIEVGKGVLVGRIVAARAMIEEEIERRRGEEGPKGLVT